MSDTPSRRKRARMVDALKSAEIALMEARIESRSDDLLIERSIINALAGVQYALRRCATLSPGTKVKPGPVVK